MTKRKPRKQRFKQDDRLKLAYIKDHPEFGNDFIGIVPKGEVTRSDLYFLFNRLLGLNYDRREPSLIEELKLRGYDPETIYFEITKAKDVPFEEYDKLRKDHSATPTELTLQEQRRAMYEDVYIVLSNFLHIEGEYPDLPSNEWYELYREDPDKAKRLAESMVSELRRCFAKLFSRDDWTGPKTYELEYKVTKSILDYLSWHLKPSFTKDCGFKVDNPEALIKDLEKYLGVAELEKKVKAEMFDTNKK